MYDIYPLLLTYLIDYKHINPISRITHILGSDYISKKIFLEPQTEGSKESPRWYGLKYKEIK